MLWKMNTINHGCYIHFMMIATQWRVENDSSLFRKVIIIFKSPTFIFNLIVCVFTRVNARKFDNILLQLCDGVYKQNKSEK